MKNTQRKNLFGRVKIKLFKSLEYVAAQLSDVDKSIAFN